MFHHGPSSKKIAARACCSSRCRCSPAALFAAAGLPPFEFNGVLVESGKTSVSLLNLSTGSAKWVVVGGKFDGYVVTACDASKANPVVFLTSPTGTRFSIPLKSAPILSSSANAPPSASGDESLKSAILGLPASYYGQPQIDTNRQIVPPSGGAGILNDSVTLDIRSVVPLSTSPTPKQP